VPSPFHEAWIEIFRAEPELATALAAAQGVDLPDHADARPAPGEYCDIRPSGVHSDTPIILYDDEERPVFAIVMEIQLGRDDEKRRSWPLYAAALHHRLNCSVVTLVACPAPLVKWCGRTLHLGPDFRMIPRVIGLNWVPVITDLDEAGRYPAAAALSAMGHGDGPHRSAVLKAFFHSLTVTDPDQAPHILDIVHTALSSAAQHDLEALVTAAYDRPQSTWGMKFFDKGLAEGEALGRAEGEARALLIVLRTRGIEVPDGSRTQIVDCTDLAQLETWTARAATATRIEDVLD
jgi:hypothetical protein